MYSTLVEKLVENLNEKDLILSGMVYKQDLDAEIVIFGMCRLDNLEHNLQGLATVRDLWTQESTTPRLDSGVDVRIRNMNFEASLKCLGKHPVLCTVDLDNLADNLAESLVALPQLS